MADTVDHGTQAAVQQPNLLDRRSMREMLAGDRGTVLLMKGDSCHLQSPALVATARGDRDDERALIARRLEETHAALGQVLDWIDSLPFDVDELAQIAAAASRRRSEVARINPARDESVPTNEADLRAVPFGSGWLEWRLVSKPSGRQFGPYVLYTPAQFAGGLFYRLN